MEEIEEDRPADVSGGEAVKDAGQPGQELSDELDESCHSAREQQIADLRELRERVIACRDRQSGDGDDDPDDPQRVLTMGRSR